MKNNVLIISGSGFIGSHLAHDLGYKSNVTVLSRYHHRFFPDIPNIDYVREDWAQADYKKLLSNKKFHKAIMLGWSDHPRSSNVNLLKSFAQNVVANMSIIDSIINYSESDIFFASSHGALPYIDKCYSDQSISGYAAGKMAIENYLNTYSKIYRRRITSLRISNPYGRYQDPKGTQGVIPIALYMALKKQKIPMLDGCEVKKDYIYIGDVSKQIIFEMSKTDSDDFSIREIRSGFLASAIDIMAYINIHVPLLDLIPVQYRHEVERLSNLIMDAISRKDDSHVSMFSEKILEIRDWINDLYK